MSVCMYVCVHARKYMVRGPSVDGDPVLHVLAGSSVGVAAKVNHVCPSKQAAGRTGRDGIESGSMSFFFFSLFLSAYNSDRERHTDRDLCSLRSRALVFFG